ncbi:hypothetical protein [Streptomyces sp. NPDC055400]
MIKPASQPLPALQDVIKTAVTVITLIGVVLAGLYAYRKRLLSEGDSHRADADQLAERCSKAAEQLGHDQRSAVPPRASHRLLGARWSAQTGCLR